MKTSRILHGLTYQTTLQDKIARRLAALPILPDEIAVKLLYGSVFHRTLDLGNPRTFNEKLQWLKLYDHNPVYTKLVDKHAVKEWAASKMGSDRVVPTVGVWESFDDIDFAALPDSFVLKCTHDSGSTVICRDARAFDRGAARKKLTRALRRNFFYAGREWPYRDVPPHIICEPYIEDFASGELPDYKFLCFDGEPRIMYVATCRQTMPEPYFDFFDMDFKRLDIRNGHPNSPSDRFAKPVEFELMKEFAAELSSGMPHVRVDFYEVGGRAVFGEMTFYHNCGLLPFEPFEWDERLGSWLTLPERRS